MAFCFNFFFLFEENSRHRLSEYKEDRRAVEIRIKFEFNGTFTYTLYQMLLLCPMIRNGDKRDTYGYGQTSITIRQGDKSDNNTTPRILDITVVYVHIYLMVSMTQTYKEQKAQCFTIGNPGE